MDPKLSHTLPSFPPQNGVDFETHNHDKRARQKPDLRLAESYIPAALLTLKICFYTTMIPLVLFTQSRFSIMIISLYTIVLYFDHIYLVFTKNPFIDSTAVCLDILASNILCLVFPKNAQALFPTIIFVIWGICGSIYIAVIPSQKTSSREFYRFCTHIVTVLIFVSLLSTDATAGEPLVITNSTAIIITVTDTSQYYWIRNMCYTLLVLVDSYTFRPLFQQESERVFLCKYGAVLFSPWYLSLILTLCFSVVQGLKVFRIIDMDLEGQFMGYNIDMYDESNKLTGNDTTSCAEFKHTEDGCDVSKLDVMEAFRMAKQQYTSTNSSPSYHGGKKM
jgi:hypothetical protein